MSSSTATALRTISQDMVKASTLIKATSTKPLCAGAVGCPKMGPRIAMPGDALTVAGSDGGTGDAASSSAADAGGGPTVSSRPATVRAAPDAPNAVPIATRAPATSLPTLPMELWDLILCLVSSEDIIDSDAATRGVSPFAIVFVF